jgi:ATP-dependent Clp protease adaptor protein ClpS
MAGWEKKITIFVPKPLTMSAKERLQESLLVDQKEKDLHEIVLFNDEVNTFDHVIQTLIAVCEHTPEQAEQCSLIVHYNGKCTVKTGEFDDLKPRCTRLLEAGLSAELV